MQLNGITSKLNKAKEQNKTKQKNSLLRIGNLDEIRPCLAFDVLCHHIRIAVIGDWVIVQWISLIRDLDGKYPSFNILKVSSTNFLKWHVIMAPAKKQIKFRKIVLPIIFVFEYVLCLDVIERLTPCPVRRQVFCFSQITINYPSFEASLNFLREIITTEFSRAYFFLVVAIVRKLFMSFSA